MNLHGDIISQWIRNRPDQAIVLSIRFSLRPTEPGHVQSNAKTRTIGLTTGSGREKRAEAARTHMSRVLPVSRSCIMACLSRAS